MLGLMKKTLFACLIVSLFATPAFAQSERAEQMRRVIDGLNSADPVTRLITLEEALATKDKNITRIAIQTAMANADTTLRSAAIEGVFATKKVFTIDIKSAQDQKRAYVLEKSGGRVDLKIANFNQQTGDFFGYSSFSYQENIPNTNGKRRPKAYPGNFSGDRLTFTVNLYDLISGNCVGVVEANEGSSLLTGSMSCRGGTYGVYKIEIDILR